MSERTSAFHVLLQTGEAALHATSDSAIVSADGLFLSRIHLPKGARVTVQIEKGPRMITLHGIVCADCGELGVAVKFEDIAAADSQALSQMFPPDVAAHFTGATQLAGKAPAAAATKQTSE